MMPIFISLAGIIFLCLFGLLMAVNRVTNLFKERALTVRNNLPTAGFEVMSFTGDLITLRDLGSQNLSLQPKLVGLSWDGGYAQMGKVVEVNGRDHTRTFTLLHGMLSVGIQARIDYGAFPGDPGRAHGIEFENALFESPVGQFDAWYVDGSGPIWVIFVHGHRTGPAESLRILPLMVSLSLPSFAIKYRNDYGAPHDESEFHRFGLTEWEDLEGAVKYGLDHGAEQFVLIGYSMGGSIVMNFLYKSDLANRIVGIVLDSPMLDLNATVDFAARRRHFPNTIISLAKRLVTKRFGLQWDMVNYLKNIHLLKAPVLLLHSESDNLVPVSTSDWLASLRPDKVIYKRVDRAPHGGIWNTEKDIYEKAVQNFIEGIIGPKKVNKT